MKKIAATAGLFVALSLAFGLANAQSSTQTGANAEASGAGNTSAYGTHATASGQDATAIGGYTVAGTTQNSTFGGGPQLVISPTYSYYGQTAVGTGSMAWGSGDTAAGSGAIAVSQPALGTFAPATAVGRGATVWGNDSVAVGGYSMVGSGTPGTAPTSNITVTGAVAIGSYSRAAVSNTTAIGYGASAYGTTSTALGQGATAMGNNSVAIGAGTTATRANSVDVGGRQVTGVVAPTQGTDAANKDYVDQQVAAISAPDLSGINNNITNLNNRVDRLEDRINEVERKANGGVALALAMSTPAMLAPGESSIGVGTGGYANQGAIALTFAHNIQLDIPKEGPQPVFKEITISAGVGTSSAGQAGVRAGMNFKF